MLALLNMLVNPSYDLGEIFAQITLYGALSVSVALVSGSVATLAAFKFNQVIF